MKRLMKGTLVLIGMFVLFNGDGYAATFHFSTSGNNTTGDGSPANPYYSLCGAWYGAACTTGTNPISRGQVAVNPGDQLLFKRGDEWVFNDAVWTINATGAANNPVTFGAWGDAAHPRPVFRGARSVFEMGNDNWTNVAGTSIWYVSNINSWPGAVAQEDSAVDGPHLFGAYSVQGTTNANGWMSNQSMVRGTFHYDSTAKRLYVWRTDNLKPDHAAGRDIFISFAPYDGSNRLIKIMRPSGVAGSDYVFQDLHVKLAFSLGFTTSYPKTQFINCLAELNGMEGFLFDRRRFGAPLPGAKDGEMRNCVARRNNLTQGIGIGQGITIESENVWMYDSESYENGFAGVDFLDYATTTKTDGGGIVNSKIYHNGIQPTFHISFDPNVYIDGGSNITIRDSQIWGAGIDPRGTKTRLRPNPGINVDVEPSGFAAGKRPTNIKIVNVLNYGNGGPTITIGGMNGNQSAVASFSNIQIVGSTLARDRGDSDIKSYGDQNLIDYGIRVFKFNNISSGLVFKNNIVTATNTTRAPIFGNYAMYTAGKSRMDFDNNMYYCPSCNFNTAGGFTSGGFFSHSYITNMTIDQFRNLAGTASVQQDAALSKTVITSNPLLTNLLYASFDARLLPLSPALDIANAAAFPFALTGTTNALNIADSPYNDLGYHYPAAQTPPPPPADTTAPSAPSAFTALQQGTAVTMSWTASTDDTAVTGYQVFDGLTMLGTTAAPGYTLQNAVQGQTYDFLVKAFDAANNISFPSNTVTLTVGAPPDTAAPTAPTGLTATVSTTQVSLSWTASSDNVAVTGYEVLNNGQVIGTSVSTLFLHNGTAGATYNYTVRAKDAAGNTSPSSGIVTVTLASGSTTLPAPTNLWGLYTNGQAQLGWNASYSAIGYDVFRNDVFLKYVGGTSTFDNTAAPGSNRFKVRSKNSQGNLSGFSTEVTINVPGATDTTAPSAPSNTLGSLSGTQVSLSWTASTDNVAVTGYQVLEGSTLKGTTATTSYTVSGLAYGQTYAYTVKAYDAANNLSSPSNTVTLTVGAAPDSTAPTAPTGLAGTPSGTQVLLSWNASTDNVAVTAYRVFQGASLSGTTASTVYTVTGLTAGQTYSFTVVALDAAGNLSAASNALSVTLPPAPDTTAPSVPAGLTASPSGTQVALAWTVSTDNVGVTGYQVYQGSTLKGTTASTSYTVTGLTPGNYSFTVRAYDAANNISASSASASATIQGPSVPTNLVAFMSGSSVYVGWGSSTNAIGYSVHRNNSFLANTASLSLTDPAVNQGQTYSYKVRAYDAYGNNSAFSSSMSVTVPDTVPPSTPSGLSATLSGTTAALAWSPAADNVSVTGYRVYQGAALLGTTASTAYSVSGLSMGQSHTFTVMAYDAAGNLSGSSNSASVTVPASLIPGTPANLITWVGQGKWVYGSWDASANAAGYNIFRNNVFLKSVTTPSLSDKPGIGTFRYKVQAFNAAGEVSAMSIESIIAVR